MRLLSSRAPLGRAPLGRAPLGFVLLSVVLLSVVLLGGLGVLSVPLVLSALSVLSLSVLSLAGPCGRAGVHVLGGLPQPADLVHAPAGPTSHLATSGRRDASDGG